MSALIGALFGALMALVAQIGAVLVLRPVMKASTPVFMARWIAGMAIRAAALGITIAVAATNRETLPLLATSLGFLGVLLPLLFLETRFLK